MSDPVWHTQTDSDAFKVTCQTSEEQPQLQKEQD